MNSTPNDQCQILSVYDTVVLHSLAEIVALYNVLRTVSQCLCGANDLWVISSDSSNNLWRRVNSHLPVGLTALVTGVV